MGRSFRPLATDIPAPRAHLDVDSDTSPNCFTRPPRFRPKGTTESHLDYDYDPNNPKEPN